MSNASYCFTHNPATREQHAAATRKGGTVSTKSKVHLLPQLEIKDSNVILDILSDTINRMRVVREDGSMDIATANSIGHLCGKFLECRKTLVLETKLKELDNSMAEMSDAHRNELREIYKAAQGLSDKRLGIEMVPMDMVLKPIQ